MCKIILNMRRCNFQLCVKSHASTLPCSLAINTQPTKYSGCVMEIRLSLYCSLLESLPFSQLCHTCLTPTPPTTPPHPPLSHCHSITHTTLVTQVHTVTADSSPQGPNCSTPPTDTQPTPPNQARWTCTWFIMLIMSHAHNPTPTGPRRPLPHPYTVVRYY